jgi:hypothetical protein
VGVFNKGNSSVKFDLLPPLFSISSPHRRRRLFIPFYQSVYLRLSTRRRETPDETSNPRASSGERADRLFRTYRK